MSNMMYATLVHLSTNMWKEAGNTREDGSNTWQMPGSETLRWDRETWDTYMEKLRASGCNTLIVDVGDAVIYDTHPEIAVQGAFSKEALSAELQRLRAIGFTLIPKLNFATTHDYWMKDYARMVSSAPYYRFCADVIGEVIELFDAKYLHIGMDEEDYANQATYDYAVVRHNGLWWQDVQFYIAETEKHGAQAILWADRARHHTEEFIENCPKTAIPMVWYYGNKTTGELPESDKVRLEPFDRLSQAGFQVMGAGSIWLSYENMPLLSGYCREHVAQEKFLGLCQTTWQAVTPQWVSWLDRATAALQDAIAVYEKKQ